MYYKKGDKIKYIGEARLSLSYGDILEVDSTGNDDYVLVQTKFGSYLWASFNEIEPYTEITNNCDCGALKINSPFHYNWCSTNNNKL